MGSPTDQEVQSNNLAIREALNDAYAAIEGNKSVLSFAALTYDDLLHQQIARISGPDTPSRPNEINRVAKVLANVLSAVAKIQTQKPGAFVNPDPASDVNTPASV